MIAPLTRAKDFGAIKNQNITLKVNDIPRQTATLDQLLHDVPAVIAHLSGYYHLGPGDLIYTGTPAGVGPVAVNDRLIGTIDGLDSILLTIGSPE